MVCNAHVCMCMCVCACECARVHVHVSVHAVRENQQIRLFLHSWSTSSSPPGEGDAPPSIVKWVGWPCKEWAHVQNDEKVHLQWKTSDEDLRPTASPCRVFSPAVLPTVPKHWDLPVYDKGGQERCFLGGVDFCQGRARGLTTWGASTRGE